MLKSQTADYSELAKVRSDNKGISKLLKETVTKLREEETQVAELKTEVQTLLAKIGSLSIHGATPTAALPVPPPVGICFIYPL
jgi:hypothetical protein